MGKLNKKIRLTLKWGERIEGFDKNREIRFSHAHVFIEWDKFTGKYVWACFPVKYPYFLEGGMLCSFDLDATPFSYNGGDAVEGVFDSPQEAFMHFKQHIQYKVVRYGKVK